MLWKGKKEDVRAIQMQVIESLQDKVMKAICDTGALEVKVQNLEKAVRSLRALVIKNFGELQEQEESEKSINNDNVTNSYGRSNTFGF